MIGRLKSANRTLLEMHSGMLVYGAVCEIIGLFFAKNKLTYSIALWLGVLLAVLATLHMYRTLDRALDYDPESAQKMIFRGYLVRYAALVLILAGAGYTKVFHPLVVFLGYMSLKGTVYLQPTTHRIVNHLFGETDPVPMSLEELEEMEAREAAARGEDPEAATGSEPIIEPDNGQEDLPAREEEE